MERRFILGISILIVVLALTIGTAIGMKAIHAPGEAALTEAARLALAGDLEQAIPLAQGAYQRWQKYQAVTSAVADHNPMDDTERLFREMQVYAEAGEAPHFAACCTQLSAMLKAMYETNSFSLKNIL